jgi:Tol biopolymer transport system component/dienelactone hydrolase
MALLDLELLLRTPTVNPYAGVDFSPDGSWVYFAWNLNGDWEIYRLPLQKAGDPEQLTHGPGAKTCPRCSPDGRYLAYAVDLDGGEAYDIWVCDLEEQAHFNLTPDTPDAIQPNVCWLEDGKSIFLIAEQSGRFSTFALDLRQGLESPAEPVLLFNQAGPHWEVQVSPDRRWLAVGVESHGSDHAIYVLPVKDRLPCAESGLPDALPLTLKGELLDAQQGRWSPDGRLLAFSSNHLGNSQIGVFDSETGQVHWVTSGPGEKSEPDWSPDGKSLVYVLSETPDSCVVVHNLEGEIQRVQVEPGTNYCPRFSPDGRQVIFAFDNPRYPTDLWAYELNSGVVRQLTHSSTIPPEEFVMPQAVSYPSFDGAMVPAVLYLPPRVETQAVDALPPPAVILIHGGPNWHFGFLWYPLMAHMASRGWVVLAPEYRGSTGYGRAWELANRMEIGRGDALDIVAGVDYLLQNGLADPRRITVTGRSHGGYLTMCCLTLAPQRWAAGSAIVPFLNWFTSHANSRQDLQYWDLENMGDPEGNRDLWYERSPYFFLERVQAPVQLICGANDPRCPASESIQARDALQGLGKEVDFVLYLDEGHSFLKIGNVVDHELRRVNFLVKAIEAQDVAPSEN